MKLSYRNGLLAIGLFAAISVGVIMFSASATRAVPEDKVNICHADGKDGTIKFSNITVSQSAAENHLDPITGTPKAGHENDVLAVNGLCPDQSPSPSPSPSTTPGV